MRLTGRPMPLVRFHPHNTDREVRPNSTILTAANKADLPIGQSCSGEGVCGWCRVTVLEGEENLHPPTPLEQRLMDAHQFGPGERAACLAKVRGDVTITTTYW